MIATPARSDERPLGSGPLNRHGMPQLPPGILTAAVASKRLDMVVENAWDPPVRKSITDMMERAVKAGFYEKMPDEKIAALTATLLAMSQVGSWAQTRPPEKASMAAAPSALAATS